MRKLALGFALCLNFSLAWAQEVDWYGYFENDCDALSEKQIQTIHLWAASHYHLRDHTVEIRGHTDSNADSVYNLNLSERRAKSILQILEQNGFTDCRYTFYGESMPLCNQSTEECLARNRRVEVILYDTDEEKWLQNSATSAPQMIFFYASEDTFLEGHDGTVIHVPLGVLIDKMGNEYRGQVRAQLREINSTYDCMMHRISTKCNGKIIETGGMCELLFFDTRTNDPLDLNGEIEILFASQINGKEEGMQTFIGMRRPNWMEWKLEPKDANSTELSSPLNSDYTSEWYPGGSGVPKEKIEWSNSRIISINDIKLTEEEIAKRVRHSKLQKLMVNAIKVETLGWVNCDRFLNEGPLATIRFEGIEKNVAVFVVLENKRVCLMASREGVQVPNNALMTIYAYQFDEVGISFFKHQTISKNETIEVAMTNYTPEEFTEAMSSTKQCWQ